MRLTARERAIKSARAEIESALAVAVYKELSFLWRKIFPGLRRLDRQRPKMAKRRLRKATFSGDTTLWQVFAQRLEQRLTAELASGGVTINQIHNAYAAFQAGSGYEPVEFTPEELAEQARAEVGYRIKNISSKTRSDVGRLVAEWYNKPESSLGELVDDLKPLFSEKRAGVIAATETTHINSLVVRSRMEKLNIDDWWWRTERDEITCNKCREKHGKTFHRNDPMPPNASHPNCRCSPVPIPHPIDEIGPVQPKPAPVVAAPAPPPAPPPAPTIIHPGDPGWGDYADAIDKKYQADPNSLTAEELHFIGEYYDYKNDPQQAKYFYDLEQQKKLDPTAPLNLTPATTTTPHPGDPGWNDYLDKLNQKWQADPSSLTAEELHSIGEYYDSINMPGEALQYYMMEEKKKNPSAAATAYTADDKIKWIDLKNKVKGGETLTQDEIDWANKYAADIFGIKPNWLQQQNTLASTQAAPPSPPPPTVPGLNVNQYVALKNKAVSGVLLTSDEIAAAEAYSVKTWKGKVQPWIETAKQWLSASKQPVLSISMKQYVSLSHKAMRALLTPQEVMSVEAYAQKTWGKIPDWIDGQKAGKLYTKITVTKKKPKPAVTAQTPQPAAPPPPPKPAWMTATGGLDHDSLKQIDIHDAEPTWANAPYNARYGVVMINDAGEVLLREPKDHSGQGKGYDGYKWTHAKGGKDFAGQHPVEVAEKEAREETGYEVEIIGIVPGAHSSGNSTNYYFLARPKSHDPSKMDTETEQIKWLSVPDAIDHINQGNNVKGMQRDIAVLQAAVAQDAKIRAGQVDYSYLFRSLVPTPPPPPPKPKKKPKPIKTIDLYAQQAGFPTSADQLKTIKGLGGSTGAQLVEDPSTGRRFVMKRGNSADHLLEEAHADAVYRAIGANVPEFQVYNTPQGPVKVSAYIDNARTLDSVMSSGTAAEKKKVRAQLQQHFAADALLGNWDVIGMGADNIMVDADGKVWRIDNGGSLRMRAQGAPKGKDWNEYPEELWTMRGAVKQPGDPAVQGANGQAVSVFGDIPYSEIGKQCRELAAKRDAILAAVPDEVRDTLGARLDHIEHLGVASEQMTKAGWKDSYQDGFGRQIIETRKAGITNILPEKLTTNKSGSRYDTKMVDENGKTFDGLRGNGKVVQSIKDRINKAGGNYDIISRWMDDQAGTSWSRMSQAFKWFVSGEMGNRDDFWWRNGQDEARQHYERACRDYGGKEVFDKTVQMYHSFIYEFLTKTELPKKNSDGTLTLIRTEPDQVISKAGAQVGDKNCVTLRGALESTSLLNPVTVGGSRVTLQRVPFSNVFGCYMIDRYPGYNGGSFLGDGENEIVVILGKQPFDYVASRPNEYKG